MEFQTSEPAKVEKPEITVKQSDFAHLKTRQGKGTNRWGDKLAEP